MEVACTVACLRSLKSMPRVSFWDSKQLALLNNREQDELRYIIDNMGFLSAQAQHLRVPITDYNRLKAGNHNLYLSTSGIPGKPDFILVKGMLKIGVKNLFIRKDNGQLVEMAPLCVLDFYVHENYQRLGLGHELFEAMLQSQKKRPHELGIDRPSAKLHSFLAKFYNLTEYLPQANQFVVFKDYFGEQQKSGEGPNQTPPCGWGRKKEEDACFLDGSKRDRVLHGRRANNRETVASNIRKPPEHHFDKCNFFTGHQQPIGRRQSREQLTQGSSVDKVLSTPNSSETWRPQPSSPVLGVRENIKSRTFVIGQQMLPSNQELKVGWGRRSLNPAQHGFTEGKKGYLRYQSPLSLPVPLEELKEESFNHPAKLSRRESTRARLFHDVQAEPQESSQLRAPLKYPYWTEDPQFFDTKHYDRDAKLDTPIPPSFQKTRSCYHAGMQGFGAAEAMGYYNRVIM